MMKENFRLRHRNSTFVIEEKEKTFPSSFDLLKVNPAVRNSLWFCCCNLDVARSQKEGDWVLVKFIE